MLTRTLTHTNYLPVSVVVAFFDRQGGWGWVGEGGGVSIRHHVLWPVHRRCFGEGTKVGRGGRGRRGGTGSRWGGMAKLWKEERNIVRKTGKERRELRERLSHANALSILRAELLTPLTPLHTHLILRWFGGVVVRGGVWLGLRRAIGQSGGRGGFRVRPELWVKLIDFTDCDIALDVSQGKVGGGEKGWGISWCESAILKTNVGH